MLIKRVSPHDPDTTKEVKYILTADVQEMAQLVGVHPERLRHILDHASERGLTYYGNARPSNFFTTACRSKRPRTLSVSQVDVRVQDRIQMDASRSLVIVPLYVMRPSFVGNLEALDTVRYELIPNLCARVPNMGDQTFYQYINLEQPFSDLARELENSEGFEISHELMGWDLVMLPGEGGIRLPDDVAEHVPTPKDEENIIFDYGFGLYCECVYTSDNRGGLRIDHYLNYKDEVIYTTDAGFVLEPSVLLTLAASHFKEHTLESPEAIALIDMISTSTHYRGIGYRRS